MFQYPRADRLIVGGLGIRSRPSAIFGFQYPRADRLIVGALVDLGAVDTKAVSVSSCGSTYCWGYDEAAILALVDLFQYPRADRLIVGAAACTDREPRQPVSVSSCGSTYCWGAARWTATRAW